MATITVQYSTGDTETLAADREVVFGSRARYLPIQETQGECISADAAQRAGIDTAARAAEHGESTVWVRDDASGEVLFWGARVVGA